MRILECILPCLIALVEFLFLTLLIINFGFAFIRAWVLIEIDII
jgi:hypothetical protein